MFENEMESDFREWKKGYEFELEGSMCMILTVL